MKKQIRILSILMLTFVVSIDSQDEYLDPAKVPQNLRTIVNKKLPNAIPDRYSWYKMENGYAGSTAFSEGKEAMQTQVSFSISNKGKFEAEYKVYPDSFSKYIPEKITKKAIESCSKLKKGIKPEPAYARIFIDDNAKVESYLLYYLLESSNSACATNFDANGKMKGKAEDVGAIEM
jgi:hypothetical protein